MKISKPTANRIAKTTSWEIWEKSISEFAWEYEQNETCYILEGSAEVTAENGEKISFKKGDWVEFEAGLKCTWKIVKDIKKKYMFS